jgi:hypothetical protein
MIASVVYLLCALTSFFCAILLFRSYTRTRNRLLFWSSAFFIVLTISNILLVVDLLVIPEIDLSLLRAVTTLIGILMLLYGLIWKGEN